MTFKGYGWCKVLGFDPGFASLGVGAVWLDSNNELGYCSSVTIRTSPKDSEVVRFGQIATELDDILEKWCYSPGKQLPGFEIWAGFEGQRFRGNARGAANVASSVGLILAALGRLEDVKVKGCEQVAPAEMKRIVTGSGTGKKDEVFEGLDRLFGRDDYGFRLGDAESFRGWGFSPHEIDALGIATVVALRLKQQREGG